MLSGVRIGPGGKIERLGGTFNPLNNTFSFWTNRAGADNIYAVHIAPDIQRISLVVGSVSYQRAGLDGTFDNAFDVAPVIIENRTMVPLRLIAEGLGAQVSWDGDTRTVTMVLDGETLAITIGETVPGMEVPAMIISDRTMVPLRYVSESFSANVIWDPQTRGIDIFR